MMARALRAGARVFRRTPGPHAANAPWVTFETAYSVFAATLPTALPTAMLPSTLMRSARVSATSGTRRRYVQHAPFPTLNEGITLAGHARTKTIAAGRPCSSRAARTERRARVSASRSMTKVRCQHAQRVFQGEKITPFAAALQIPLIAAGNVFPWPSCVTASKTAKMPRTNACVT